MLDKTCPSIPPDPALNKGRCIMSESYRFEGTMDRFYRDFYEQTSSDPRDWDEQTKERFKREAVALQEKYWAEVRQNFAWPKHPLKPDELDSYTTERGIITRDSAPQPFMPTHSDRADFARLFPDDDECCPPWERMGDELIGAGWKPSELPDMGPSRVLKAIAAVRATRTEPETTPALAFIPTPAQLNIMGVLHESPAAIGQVDIEQRSGHPRSVVQKRLTELEQKGFVHRPHGKRSGYTLTADGQSVIDAKSGR